MGTGSPAQRARRSSAGGFDTAVGTIGIAVVRGAAFVRKIAAARRMSLVRPCTRTVAPPRRAFVRKIAAARPHVAILLQLPQPRLRGLDLRGLDLRLVLLPGSNFEYNLTKITKQKTKWPRNGLPMVPAGRFFG